MSRTPPTSDVEVVRRVIAYLENRRVLYDSLTLKCRSAASLRDLCHGDPAVPHRPDRHRRHRQGAGGVASGDAGRLPQVLEDLGPLDARLHSWEARRKFLEDLGPLNWHGGYGGLDDYLLNQALGALPRVFGIHVGQLAVRYGIDVEDRLTSILPAADEEP